MSAAPNRVEGITDTARDRIADLKTENADLADQLRRLTYANDSRSRIRSEICEKATRYDELIHALKFFEEKGDFFKTVLVDIAGGSTEPVKSAAFALYLYPE